LNITIRITEMQKITAANPRKTIEAAIVKTITLLKAVPSWPTRLSGERQRPCVSLSRQHNEEKA
jgi:hypothetical protein